MADGGGFGGSGAGEAVEGGFGRHSCRRGQGFLGMGLVVKMRVKMVVGRCRWSERRVARVKSSGNLTQFSTLDLISCIRSPFYS